MLRANTISTIGAILAALPAEPYVLQVSPGLALLGAAVLIAWLFRAHRSRP